MKYFLRVSLVIFIYLFICLISRFYKVEYCYKQIIDIPDHETVLYQERYAEYCRADSALFNLKTIYVP